ncbi:polysaccharide biosynthesis tyrosine autokinase [Ilyomonas limi]|uniref:non-specific protein-tyrosine kinase n=1 Tax=Ilyomonas limi TaxID=2575867 RepID=A0A4U3L7F4_9BACT|nr:polysaccharide biosynthesis tyrosine autokinase [Ilyomonas limi]TKK70324.1 polysaccharide biosynthesis tyrosine autokinase [Ilyomonas limi]
MQPNILESEQPQDNLLRPLLLKYLSYWPLFLVLLILCGAGALLYLQFKVPVYELKATIIIKDEQKGMDDSKMIESLDVFSSKKLVENEIEVIKSQTLAQEVVRKLHLYAPVSEKGRFTDRSAYIASPVQIVAKYPDSIEAVNKVNFTYNAGKQQVVINHTAYPLLQWVNSPYGVLKFMPNPNYGHQPSRTANTLYFSLVPVEYVADDLVATLEVSASNKLSTVVNISFKDELPQRGKAIVNELIAAYNRAAVVEKNILAANTLAFVQNRLQYVVQELDSVETNLQHFKTQNKIVDIDAQGKQFLQNVGENDQKIGDLNMQLAVLDQVENYVLGKGGKGSIVPSTFGITDPVLSNLLEKLYNTELEYEKVKKIAPENNPILVSITDQISKIKPGILDNIKSQRKGLIAGKRDLETTNGKYTSMLSSIPSKERKLLEISRQQSIKNNIYTFLLQKREEAAISYASAVANSRLVDSAIASKYPVSPNKLTIYLIALVVAVGSGATYIEVKGFLNTNISSRNEIEKYTSVPIVGELVKSDFKTPVVVSEDASSLIAEEFRQLRTALGYLGINARKKRLLITSSISAEGKSFVAVNLAMSLALANKKVALVDIDLRRPALASMLNMAETEGISQYLKGEKEIEAIIKRTEYSPNLFLIPSGPATNNPSELLLNGKIEDLFTYLAGAFEYIIIDTSPMNPVTDASILSPLCDATLYIIRQSITPRMFVQKLDKYSRVKNLKNIAIVLNGVNTKGFNRYNNGYSYGYSYVENKKNIIIKGLGKIV